MVSQLISTLATSLILAQVGPGLGPTDIVPGVGGEGTYAQVCTKHRNGRLSMRTGPGQGYRKVKEIPDGHTVAIFNGRYSSDGFWWWQAAHNGSYGWVRADYVCGDPQ